MNAGDKEKLTRRYIEAAHRVQTAVAFNSDGKMFEPKHLRVGIDMSKSDMGGLATLLIAKGVFTEAEYLEAIADAAEREADTQEHELSVRFGVNVTTL